MASVAICPHCYLQLIVPDDVERDALVECPTCAKEFDLGDSVLREIPAVVRVERARIAESEAKQVAAAVEADVQTDVIREIQARIEAEIAENGLHAGVRELLPPGPPDTPSERLADTVRRPDTEPAAWFRQTETVPEIPPTSADDEQELTPASAAEEVEVLEVAEFVEVEVERAEDVAESNPEALKSQPVTLADLLPPHGQADESLPGPSFDLPNVRLMPDNGATIEMDSSVPIGPAAKTEFELEGVDFEMTPADEVVPAEAAVYHEPDFHKPEPVSGSGEPLVLPKLPRARRKRSVVRTLVGLASSSVVGLSLGYLALLYLRGPDGDLLHLAQYLPSVVLPEAFQSAPVRIAQSAEPPAPSVGAAAEEPVAEATDSENVPASYVEESPTAPAPLPTDTAAEDDRYDNAPSPLEEPAAAPIAPATAPLPLSGPIYTTEQLNGALDAGEQAKSGLVTGDLSDAAVRRTKGMSYAKLCDLAHALVFLDRSSPTDESKQLQQRAGQLFGEVLSDARVRDEVNRIAAIWIDSPHRRHGGVFLAGQLSGGQIAGDVYEYQLAVDQGDKLVLLMQEPLDPLVGGSNHLLGVVGTIVDKPAEQVTGYRGTAPRAIWVESTIPLD